jgi:uncharacterized protein YjbI with pentapeptide repeats
MARLSANDVLSRYAAGERDFRAATLSGCCFRGANLSGSDFSGADLRSTNFRDALLERTNFSGAIGGLQRRWSVVHLIISLLLTGVAGLLIGLLVLFLDVGYTLEHNGLGHLPAIAITGGTHLFYLPLAWEGLTKRAIIIYTAAGSIAFISILFSFAPLGNAAAGAFIVAPTAAIVFATASAVAFSVAGSIVLGGSIVVTFATASATALVGSSGTFADYAGRIVFILSILVIMTRRMAQSAPGYNLSTSIALASVSNVGTRFSGADLRGAFLNGARLRGSNFASSPGRPTQVDQVCWKGARSLEWARLDGTILSDPRIRNLLVEADGVGQDLSGLNLRGAYLEGGDFRGASFRNANLIGAILANANLEGANLAGAQCIGTDFSEAHLTGACLEAWNIDSGTNLHGVDCAYVYLLESHDAQGHRRDDHQRERLPHDPEKSFESGDFEAYFKQVLQEVKLLIRNGVDPKAFQHAFQAVMRQHPQITPQSLTGIKLIGNDVMATLQIPAGSDKAAIEHTFATEYLPMMLENARLKGLQEGQRQRDEDHRVHRKQIQQVLETVARLAPATGPPAITIENRPSIHIDNDNSSNTTHTTTAMTHNEIKAGDASFINTGTYQPSGGIVHLGDLSDRARITYEAVPDTRQDADQPTLRELLRQLKASIESDTSLSDTTKADAPAEVNDLAQAAQDPAQNAGLARRSINALKGLNEGIGESFKLATTLKSLLPLIAGFF